jgi:Rrf2 family protein
MKFSSAEEYGLRCLLRIARARGNKGLTIPQISKAEGITEANVGKILRILRLGGFLESSRGQSGGYMLTKSAEQIYIKDVLNALGGRLYDDGFCNVHAGIQQICSNTVDCSIKLLWQLIQNAVDGVIEKLTLKDLLASNDVIVPLITLPDKENASVT